MALTVSSPNAMTLGVSSSPYLLNNPAYNPNTYLNNPAMYKSISVQGAPSVLGAATTRNLSNKKTSPSSVTSPAQSSFDLLNKAGDEQRRLSAEQDALLVQRRNEAIQAARDASAQQIGANQSSARLTKQDIDAYLANTLATGEANRLATREQAARSRVDVEDTLRRNFASRGALDSTFFAGALAKGVGGISEQENKNLGAIDAAISSAKSQVESQKVKIDTELQNKIDEINTRTNQYVSEVEMATLEKLQNTSINLANTLLQLDQQRISIQQSLADTANSTNAFANNMTAYTNEVEQAAKMLLVPGGRDQLLAYYTRQTGDPAIALQQVEAAEAYIRNIKTQQGVTQ